MSQESNEIHQFRSVSDAEVDGVEGGFSPLFMAGVVIGVSWDLPVGTTKGDAAKALGVSHLL